MENGMSAVAKRRSAGASELDVAALRVDVAADALQEAVKRFIALGGSVDDATAWLLARTLTVDARVERAGRKLLKSTRLGPLGPHFKLQAFPSPYIDIGE
jgi:hypothetical protein